MDKTKNQMMVKDKEGGKDVFCTGIRIIRNRWER
jgi:hypothetical protein